MIDYNYKVRNGQNKSWEDKSSPRHEDIVHQRCTLGFLLRKNKEDFVCQKKLCRVQKLLTK